MKYYRIIPEVPGHFGDNTELEQVDNTFQVHRLDYVFDGWQGSDIMTSHPIFMVTKRLRDSILQDNLSGFTSIELIQNIEKSEEYEAFFGDKSIPDIYWLKVDGLPYTDDFGIDNNNDLIVSERVVKILTRYDLTLVQIEETS